MEKTIGNSTSPHLTRVWALLCGCLLALSPAAAVAASFSSGNLAVIQAEASADNTTASMIELNTTTAGQSAVQTIAINGTTMPNALRFNGSATSTMYLSLNNDRTLLVFNGANINDTAANVNTYLNRGVGTLNPLGTFSLAATYTGGSGKQTRSASSVDNVNWLIGDQGGIYTNGATAASVTGNMRGIKAFGGTVYGLTASTTLAPVGTVTATAYTGLTGLAVGNSSKTDFYLIASGSNGSTYDLLYTTEASGNAAGVISKYSLVSGSWTANGTYTTTFGGFGLAAEKSGTNVYLYVTTGQGALTANSVLKLTDTNGYNSTIGISTASNVTLYTATPGKIAKGISFAPNGIVTSGTLSAFSTTYGTASASSSVSVAGAGLTADIVVTAPSGFEVSTTAGSGYGASVTLTQSGGTVSATTVYVRLAATTTVGAYSGNVVCTSTGVTTQNVAVPSSSVSAKSLTITGLNGVSKSYDGTTTATLAGTPALSGVLAGDTGNVTLGGTPSANFATAGVGAAKSITVTGYTLSGSAASNYALTEPTGLTANINQAALTITANNVSKALGATLTGGAGSLAFGSSGLVNSETIGSVTITYGSGAASGDPVGSYPGQVTPSAAVGGTFTAANYSITYVSGDISVTVSPSITLSGTLSAVNTTYGSASATPASFTASGVNLTGNLTVTAPTGFEVSTSSSTSYGTSLTLTASGGSVAVTTLYVRLAATNAVGSYSGNVSVSGGGASTQTIAIPSSSVAAKGLTITGLSGVNKTYDRNTTAALAGTAALSGVLAGDAGNVSLTGTPSATFATATVGTAKAIIVTGYSLTGSAASQYTLTQPTGLTADITNKALTITGAAVTAKVYDGTTAATITGTLSGVIAPDVVTFNGTGTFASANPGTGIAVTSTSTLSGADAGNYSLTQPTGLTGTITANTNAYLASLALGGSNWLSPTFSSSVFNYTTYPDHSSNSITITPTLSDTNATVTVNGTVVASGSASAPVSLSVGTNLITIVVTAQDGVTARTNILNAFRSAAPLPTGSIAFVGFNADGNDDVAFVALTNLPANTVIHLTDFNWNGSAIGSGGSFAFTESEWVWIAPASGLAAGTIVAFANVGSGTITATVGSTEFVDAANRGLSTSSETVYAFQGATHAPTVFLAGITSESGTPFQNTGLSSGAAVTLSSSSDGARYKGARTGQATFAGYLTLLADVASNWDDIGGGDGTTYLPFSSTPFTASGYDANVSINSVSITEGDAGTKTLTFTVTRSSSAGTFTVDYATANGTATTANNDYVATTGTLSFTAGGGLTASINVTINGDTTVEADETFVVNLSNVANFLGTATITASQGTGTILNDDLSAPDIVIYLTGSTAFRSVAYAAIASLYNTGFTVNAANGSGAPFTTIANPQAPNRPTADSLFNEASYVSFSGTMPTFGSQIVAIRCNWSGSVAGLRDVAQQNSIPFLSSVVSQTSAFTDNGTTGVPDFCLSDVAQSTTIYKSPTLQNTTLGVIPYLFVKNQGASANLTNLTHQHAQTLFANGVVSLGSITGDTVTGAGSDTNKVVCLIGGSSVSGVRAAVFADTGYGALKNASNYKYDGSSKFIPVTPDPNVGYPNSIGIQTDLGASASQAIGVDGSSTVTGYAVGYLCPKHAFSVAGNSAGALNLTYDGAVFSTSAVQNGTYSLWSYERLYHRSTISANLTTFRGVVTDAFINNLGSGASAVGIRLQDMKVSRSVDGGPIATTY
jgi:hypothetical protein